MDQTLEQKLAKLKDILQGLGRAAIAFSGGTDSSLLAAAAKRVLGERTVAITACSETLPQCEREQATAVASHIGIQHVLLNASELSNDAFVANGPDRCYHCKQERYGILLHWAAEQGYHWLIEGSNVDDLHDYRPGMKSLAEMERVRCPLLEAGMTKAEVRLLSREWGLPTWDQPSAACLSSRLAYGLPITAERLAQVERAEQIVRSRCGGQIRVRHHGNLARIEVEPERIPLLAAQGTSIAAALTELGFTFVALDLEGYRLGSMNSALPENKART